MPDQQQTVPIAFLEHFLDVWNQHDLDAILDALEPDCLYLTSAGARLEGHDEIREGLATFLRTYPDAHWRDAVHFVSGDRGASEWIFTATGPDGMPVEVDSCDIFTFRNGRMARVSAFARPRGT